MNGEAPDTFLELENLIYSETAFVRALEEFVTISSNDSISNVANW